MNKTMIFAHRGANKEAAENTRSAFDKALQYPIDGMETVATVGWISAAHPPTRKQHE